MEPGSLIALYHAVGTTDATGYRDAIPAERLARQLAWLKQHYRLLPLDEMLDRSRRGQTLAGLAAVTFDDNHRSVLTEALPLVASLDLPATWFLIGDPLRGRPFWRDLVRQVEASGRTEEFLAFAREREPQARLLRAERFYRDSKDPQRISTARMADLLQAFLPGARAPADFVTAEELAATPPPRNIVLAGHSARHLLLAGLPEAVQRRDIAEGLATLETLPWPRQPILALPFGDPGTYDAATFAAARALGLQGVLLTQQGLAAADDLSRHALAEGQEIPVLARSLLARVTLPDT